MCCLSGTFVSGCVFVFGSGRATVSDRVTVSDRAIVSGRNLRLDSCLPRLATFFLGSLATFVPGLLVDFVFQFARGLCLSQPAAFGFRFWGDVLFYSGETYS